jgi:hypothetical protein
MVFNIVQSEAQIFSLWKTHSFAGPYIKPVKLLNCDLHNISEI